MSNKHYIYIDLNVPALRSNMKYVALLENKNINIVLICSVIKTYRRIKDTFQFHLVYVLGILVHGHWPWCPNTWPAPQNRDIVEAKVAVP